MDRMPNQPSFSHQPGYRLRRCFVPFFACVAMTVVLSACGGSGESESTPAETTGDGSVPTDSSMMENDAGGSGGAGTSADRDSNSTPAGGFELPPGDLPDPEGLDGQEESGPGGLQLPSEFDPSADTQSSSGGDSAGSNVASNAGADGEVTIQFASWDEVRREATETGKVTVVDLWSLACGPCLKEYPNLVALQKRFPSRVRAIGANVDFDGRRTRPPKSYEPRVREFLDSVDAAFVNFIVRTPSNEVYDSVGIGSIPTVLVFDPQGELVRRFVDVGETAGFTYQADIIPLVEQLLAKDDASQNS